MPGFSSLGFSCVAGSVVTCRGGRRQWESWGTGHRCEVEASYLLTVRRSHGDLFTRLRECLAVLGLIDVIVNVDMQTVVVFISRDRGQDTYQPTKIIIGSKAAESASSLAHGAALPLTPYVLSAASLMMSR